MNPIFIALLITMASNTNTPGVYVEEVPRLPPSINAVRTAIPVFIGYTEKTSRYIPGDLILNPIWITDLVQYERLYGKGPAYSPDKVTLDSNGSLVSSGCSIISNPFVLYDSIRSFFDNGGGPCYILSVGSYQDGLSLGNTTNALLVGIGQLKKCTLADLILFPDAVSLQAGELGALQQAALTESSNGKFCIFDVKDSLNSNDFMSDISAFRDNVGTANLKHAAAYYPYLKTTYSHAFRFRDINNCLFQGGQAIRISNLTKDAGIRDRLASIDALMVDNDNIRVGISNFIQSQGGRSLESIYISKYQAYNLDYYNQTNLIAVFNYFWEIFLNIDGLLTGNSSDTAVKTKAIVNPRLLTEAKTIASGRLKKSMQTLIDLDSELFMDGRTLFDCTNSYTAYSNRFKSDELRGMFATPIAIRTNLITGRYDTEIMPQLRAKLLEIFISEAAAINLITQKGNELEESESAAATEHLPIYSNIVSTLNSNIPPIPPSGAIAGIYAKSDRDRGIWKAPADVGLVSVTGLSRTIDTAAQDGLNSDVNSGKPVNAIRAFSGQGILVWGARTLAGNDNEWRYIPVRRLFDYVEQSCKKSLEWVVFEPNDANTWTKIKGMIENFLYELWRKGALAGSKPEDAFYTRVGAGQTMSEADIAEGRINIEIGMAAVRPAEFIILRICLKTREQ